MAKTKKHRLKNLVVKEASVVDAGANQRASVLIFKHEGGDNSGEGGAGDASSDAGGESGGWWTRFKGSVSKAFGPKTTREILAAEAAHERMLKVRVAFAESMSQILAMADDSNRMDLLRKAVEEFGQEMGDLMPALKAEHAKEAEGLMTEIGTALDAGDTNALTKALNQGAAPTPSVEDDDLEEPVNIDKNATTLADILKGLGSDEERAALEAVVAAEVAKAAGSDDDKDEEPVDEMPEAVAKALATMRAENEELRAAVAKRDEEKALGEVVEVAKGLTDLGIDSEAFAMVLRTIQKADVNAYGDVVETLKGAAARVAKADQILMSATGHGKPMDDSQAGADLKAAIAKCMEGNPDLTREQALRKVLRENKALYKAYREEQAEA